MATTSTFSRTSSRSGSSFRRRAAARPRSTSRTTTASSLTRDARGRYIIPAAIAGGLLAYFLWMRISQAAPSPQPNIVPVPPTPTPPTPPTPGPNVNPFPPNATLAAVAVTTGQPGMNIRSGPNPNDTLLGSVANGGIVQIIEGGIPQQGPACAACRWARVMSRDRVTGYMRVTGPAGESNVRPASVTDVASVANVDIGTALPPAGGYPGALSAGFLPGYYGAATGCAPGTGCLARWPAPIWGALG